MASLFDFSQALSKLNKEKKFAEALKFFKDNKGEFTPEQIGLNKFIVFEMISALIETNHYDVIFNFIEQYNVVLDPKNFYYLLKKFKDKPSVNWTVVNRFCDLVNPEQLDTECKTIEVERKGVKKPMELASAKEDWYAFKTKALYEAQHYQECFNLSKKALESFEKFHYSNEVWFARRIALSKKHLGNSDEALNELLQVLKRKKEWFIQNEVAEIYKEKGEIDKAFNYATDAINNFGDIEYKVGLLVLIGDLLKSKGEQELSFKHYLLSKLLRLQEEWSVPSSLTSTLNQFSFSQTDISGLPKLKAELKNYWNSLKPQQTEKKHFPKPTKEGLKGRIDKILHNDEKGADGFLKYDNSKSVYFRVNATDTIISKLKVGLEVEFKLLPPKDDKKEKAINLKIIE